MKNLLTRTLERTKFIAFSVTILVMVTVVEWIDKDFGAHE